MTVTRRAFIRHLSAAALVGTAALTLSTIAAPKTFLQLQAPDGEWTDISELMSLDPPDFDRIMKQLTGPAFTMVYDPSKIF